MSRVFRRPTITPHSAIIASPLQASIMFPHNHHFLQQPHPQFLQPNVQLVHHQPHISRPAKTVYIISYSSDKIKRDVNGKPALQHAIPYGIPVLLTVFCQTWRPPAQEVCHMYSGVSPQVQEVILGSRTAMRHINEAVSTIVTHLNAGSQAAHIQTTCHFGTHRSVATAEIIGQKMRRRGVNVVITHPHRRRRPGDLVALINDWQRHAMCHLRSLFEQLHNMSFLCPVRSGLHHDPHCLTCQPSCDKLARARQTVPWCPTCCQVLPYDQTPPAAVETSLRAPTRLGLGGVKTAALNYEVAPHVFTGQYTDSKVVDRRHVHFDLPVKKTRERGVSLHSDGKEDIIYRPQPAGQARRHNTSSASDKSVYQHPPANYSRSRAKISLDGKLPSPADHRLPLVVAIPYAPPPPPPPTFHPYLPTIYILTYSTSSLSTSNLSFVSLLATQLPTRIPPIPHLYTIDARPFDPPPPSICAKYSGIAPIVQDMVLQDTRAEKAVRRAVRDILDFNNCCEAGRVRGGEVAMSVCCVYGTHRSVAIAERIAQGVRAGVGEEGGKVRVISRHVSRVKGVGDPF
ncbi:hypothetical protein T440DRAFT_493605 [Plenodomus tracheiphilus IPT5]|uniref:RapZ C-terminal domain-containing protein n=1 Tax=Plenodomus tracheiphilus IPT5 TaxID=1408161 RepID=A0A6A7ASH3_9PLEO|nr:hypothetical protein T440DRAFT_493605 [Plenodomus tracheiphilus IPT5]